MSQLEERVRLLERLNGVGEHHAGVPHVSMLRGYVFGGLLNIDPEESLVAVVAMLKREHEAKVARDKLINRLLAGLGLTSLSGIVYLLSLFGVTQ